jgi:hypothetical protein
MIESESLLRAGGSTSSNKALSVFWAMLFITKGSNQSISVAAAMKNTDRHGVAQLRIMRFGL